MKLRKYINSNRMDQRKQQKTRVNKDNKMRNVVTPATVSTMKGLGKEKRRGFYLKPFLRSRNYKKKKKKTVRTVDFVVAWPPPAKRSSCKWEPFMYQALQSVVLFLIVDEIGQEHGHENGYPWESIKVEQDHPKLKSVEQNEDEQEGEDETGYSNYDSSFDEAVNRSFGESYDGAVFYKQMVLPNACAFVHGTAWTRRLRKFKSSSGAWSEAAKRRGCEFCMNGELHDLIYSYYDWYPKRSRVEMNPNSDQFWRGFDEAYHQLGQQFSLTLDYYLAKVDDLIVELDSMFGNNHPSSLDEVLSKQVWELLVLEWIQGKREEAYLYFYSTPGDFFYYKDFSWSK